MKVKELKELLANVDELEIVGYENGTEWVDAGGQMGYEGHFGKDGEERDVGPF